MRAACLVVLLGMACTPRPTPPPPADAPDSGTSPSLRVLFVGNSYTYVHDIPALLEAMAPAEIDVESSVAPGATLGGHWEDMTLGTRARIDERRWSHVVIQGQSGEFGEEWFAGYARLLGEAAIEAGAQPVYFVTWAAGSGSSWYGTYANPDHMQDEITFAYAEAARPVASSSLACIGEAFRRSLREHPEIVLHQEDLSHATLAGAYLAASTFHVALTGRPVPSSSAYPAELGEAEVAALRESALVGADCGSVRPRAALRLLGPGPSGFPSDGGVALAFDFGAAGVPITAHFGISNMASVPAVLDEEMPLTAPFSWTSGTFPGQTPCTTTLAPRSVCTMHVTYSGDVDGDATVTWNVSGAYEDRLSLSLRGTSTDDALLSLELRRNGAPLVRADVGETRVFNIVVFNRGGAPAMSIRPLSMFSPPFSWGPSADGGGYPGGTGTTTLQGTDYEHCGAALAPGESCVLTASFTPSVPHTTSTTDIQLGYSAARGESEVRLTISAQSFEDRRDAGP